MEKTICKWIVEKFERSSKSRENIRVGNMSINLYKNKEYIKDSNYKFRFKINDYAKELQDQNLVKISWYEKDNIIEKILFNLKDMDIFYTIADIEEGSKLLCLAIKEIEDYINKAQEPWIIKYFKDLKEHIQEKKKLPYIMQNNIKKQLIFSSLIGIDDLLCSDFTMLERVFSKRYLKDSKAFENEARNMIISIIKKYKSDINIDLTNEEILQEVGIEKTTNELLLKGPIKIKLSGNVIDLNVFTYGLGLTTETLRNADVIDINGSKVISVENKANFLHECSNAQSDEIVIFSSGFYSPVQRKFLKKLRFAAMQSNKIIDVYHSGDYDYGGINIYRQIKSHIFPELQPYKMSIELYMQNLKFGESIKDEGYLDKFRNLLNDRNCIEFKLLIQRIIDERKTLEQESLLISK